MCGIATLTMVMSSTSRMAVSTTATTNAIEGRLSTSTLRMSCWSRRDVAGFFLRQARLLVIRFASGYSLYTHPSHSRGHSDEQLRYSSIARTVARLGPPWVINGHVRLREKASALPLKADILGAGQRCPLSAKSGHSKNNGFRRRMQDVVTSLSPSKPHWPPARNAGGSTGRLAAWRK